MKKITYFFVMCLFASMQVAAEIYKCTDTAGKVHYGNKPCKGESSIFTPRVGPLVDEDAEERMEMTNRLLRAYQAEHLQDRKRVAEQKADKETRVQNCHSARNRFRQVSEAGRMYRIDNDGNRVDFSDKERADVKVREAADVEKWCD